MQIWLKRVFEEPGPQDGARVLVDRLWPRGIRKEDAAVDLWLKEISPSDELRKWFGHDPDKWEEFQKRYYCELNTGGGQAVQKLSELVKKGRVTLIYAAKDERFNNAVVIKEYIEQKLSLTKETGQTKKS